MHSEDLVPTLVMTWCCSQPTALAPSCKIKNSFSTLNLVSMFRNIVKFTIFGPKVEEEETDVTSSVTSYYLQVVLLWKLN